MGAAQFRNVGYGKTPQEAFSRLVDQARYEHGHGGYSGTIAEKREYVLIQKPPEARAIDLARWAMDHPYPEGPKPYPAALAPLVEKASRVSDDKWGPAATFEITGTELDDLVRKRNLPPGTRAFVFFGWASE
jgi:hypothetical protein